MKAEVEVYLLAECARCRRDLSAVNEGGKTFTRRFSEYTEYTAICLKCHKKYIEKTRRRGDVSPLTLSK